MHRLRLSVPSANYLFVFEAAARRLSYTAAAKELNVSQPAVSKTIKLLESALGFKLFTREGGRLELTFEGRRLYQETQDAFDHLHLVIASLRRRNAKETVRVSFSASFVQSWLLPRLDDFKQLHPDISLRIEESARDDQDLEKEDLDISARLGSGAWPDVQSWHFADEEVLPVCSPGYLKAHGPIETVAQLSGKTLLHFEERHRARLTWAEWFKQCGGGRPDVSDGLVFTDNLAAMEAAILGQGIGLGWKHLIRGHLKAGRLVPALDVVYRSGKSIYLVTPAKRSTSPAADLFRDWLLAQERDAADNFKL